MDHIIDVDGNNYGQVIGEKAALNRIIEVSEEICGKVFHIVYYDQLTNDILAALCKTELPFLRQNSDEDWILVWFIGREYTEKLFIIKEDNEAVR